MAKMRKVKVFISSLSKKLSANIDWTKQENFPTINLYRKFDAARVKRKINNEIDLKKTREEDRKRMKEDELQSRESWSFILLKMQFRKQILTDPLLNRNGRPAASPKEQES